MNQIHSSKETSSAGTFNFERLAVLYLRLALGAAFLSSVASRFGWWGKNVGWGNFDNFMKYTAEVNSFMPASSIPFLAWAATVAEVFLGIAVILGFWPRWVAFGASALVAIFGVAMAISLGIKEPLDYSVFSASAGALFLAFYYTQRQQKLTAKQQL